MLVLILGEKMFEVGSISLDVGFVKLTLAQEEGEADSQNVMVEIPGTEYPDEVIVYTAHYDSVVFSHL